MKRVMLLSLVILMGASLAFGQAGGFIGTYADAAAVSCVALDIGGLLPVFVVQTLSPGSTAASFASPLPGCMLSSQWLSDTPVFAVNIGNSQLGISIGYGTCQMSPTHILTINYFVAGQTQICCAHPVVPNPDNPSGQVETVDCQDNLVFATGLINQISRPGFGLCLCEQAMPVEESTWGQVKSLYSTE